jgi:pimeloyl-ACP methyl ester carboxylesterase
MTDTEFETFTSNEFTVRRYGSGAPHAAFIGGITYAPSDFHEVAKSMPGTNYVLNNPIHTGKVPRTREGTVEEVYNWKDWLREKYKEVLCKLECPLIVSHSLGTLYTSQINKHIPGLHGFVLANPPTNKKGAYAEKYRLKEFGLLDKCMADCCTDLTEEQYRAMLTDHEAEYITDAPPRNLQDIFRHEIPHPIPEAVETMISAVRESAVPVLFVTGKQDPWNGNNIERVTCLDHVSHAELDTNHFPQISNPDEFTNAIESWKQVIERKS